MSLLDRDVIERKLKHILSCMEGLRPLIESTLERYRADDLRKKGGEKYVIELAGAAIDLNYHLIAGLGK